MVKQALKKAVLPDPGPRRFRFGIARGCRMLVDFDSQTHIYLGLYEMELNRYLRRLLRSGTTTFDVGVQHGYDSLLVANQTRASVASFECDPKCIERMRLNFALNSEIEGLITIIEGTVGDGADDIRLDQWAYGEKGFVPDLIKIDIDGGEVGALRSAERLLSERKPSLVVETHSPELEAECGRMLVEHGYEPVIVNQRRVLPDRRPIPHNRWLVAFGSAAVEPGAPG
jgi:Methyltransferase FkbM domain